MTASAHADGFHPSGDVFDTAPPAASAAGKPSCKVAQDYVNLINGGQYHKLSELFAEDAVFLTPIGKVLHGRKEIGDFYAGLLGKLLPKIVPISFIADGSSCVMELAAQTSLDADSKYRLAAIDHFTVNQAGLIAHMIVYLRPDAKDRTAAMSR